MTKSDFRFDVHFGINNALGRLYCGVANYRLPRRGEVLKQIMQIRRGRKMRLSTIEAYQLYASARAAQKVPGDAAEVGVFRGASAKLIRLALPHK